MKLTPTGVAGLDELLGGGLPKGRSILVAGSPGSGKTTLAMQFIYAGAKMGERGLFVGLDERLEHIRENFESFGWDLEGEERRGQIIFLDASNLKFRKASKIAGPWEAAVKGTSLKELLETIKSVVEEESVERISVDPITSVAIRYENEALRRRAILAFFDALSSTGCTSLITTELRASMLRRMFQVEEFLSQGVIILHTLIRDGNVIRAIQVEKMRGIPHDPQLRPYVIGPKGIEVYPREKVF